MANSSSKHHLSLLTLFLLTSTILFLSKPTSCSSSSSTSSPTKSHLSKIQSICKTTPYPDTCFNNLKLTISIDILPNLLNFLLHTLGTAIDEATKLSSILATTTSSNLVEKQRGTVQDCKDLHQITILSLHKSVSRLKSSKVADAKALLSGALTNKVTCLEGLATASGPRKQTLVNSFIDAYKHVSNSLSMLVHPSSKSIPNDHKSSHGRRLLFGAPILKDDEPYEGVHQSPRLVDPLGSMVLYNSGDREKDEDDNEPLPMHEKVVQQSNMDPLPRYDSVGKRIPQGHSFASFHKGHIMNRLPRYDPVGRRIPQSHNNDDAGFAGFHKGHIKDPLSRYDPVGSQIPQGHNNDDVGSHKGHIMDPPSWLDRIGRRILQDYNNDDGTGYDQSDEPSDDHTFVVAKDGSGNFTSVQDAINFAPNNSEYRIFIYVKEGVYEENVEIPSYKPNIVLLGEGSNVTVITGNRSVADGWTTFRSATVAVSAEGFLARDLTFENSAGPAKYQAVALRINADLAALYRCTILGFQDTLYVHSFRQFYRECDIYGTIDYIFGNAAVVFQGCTIVSRMPMPGQYTVITAQSRDMPEETTGMSLQNCSVLPTEELYSNRGTIKSFLGRPWKQYARTVFIESYLDDFIDPLGWTKWSGDDGLDTVYYGEYGNQGPGARTEGRVTWAGYHVMGYEEASNFTVSQFIVGDEWLDSTSFPYDEGI